MRKFNCTSVSAIPHVLVVLSFFLLIFEKEPTKYASGCHFSTPVFDGIWVTVAYFIVLVGTRRKSPFGNDVIKRWVPTNYIFTRFQPHGLCFCRGIADVQLRLPVLSDWRRGSLFCELNAPEK